MSDHKTIYGKGADLRNPSPLVGTLALQKGDNTPPPPGLISTTSCSVGTPDGHG